jgi:hypothetical protein
MKGSEQYCTAHPSIGEITYLSSSGGDLEPACRLAASGFFLFA